MGISSLIVIANGQPVIPIDDSGAITGYVNALPVALGVSAATAAAVPASYAPGGTPITGTGRIAYSNAAVAYYDQGTPYTADGRIATGAGPAVRYDQGTPYNAAGQIVVQSAAPPTVPADLFLAGELGCWLDPSDLSTMWQDSAKTTPVTAAGQPVGAINDKSGRGLHFTQATAASRPILQTEGGRNYLDFDGTDDGMVSAASINYAAANGKITVWVGLYKGAPESAAGQIIEFSPSSGANSNCFAMQGPPGDLNGYFWRSRGVSGGDGTIDLSGYPAPIKNVVVGIGDVAADISTIRVDSVATTVNTDQGTGGYGTYQFFLGRRGGTTFPFRGRIYGLIMRGTVTSTPQQILDIERYMGTKTGVTIP